MLVHIGMIGMIGMIIQKIIRNFFLVHKLAVMKLLKRDARNVASSGISISVETECISNAVRNRAQTTQPLLVQTVSSREQRLPSCQRCPNVCNAANIC